VREISPTTAARTTSLEFDAAFFQRLTGYHEGRHAAFHVRDAEALDFTVDDLAPELGLGLHPGDHAAVFLGARKARVGVAVESETEARAVAFDNADGVGPVEFDVLAHRFDAVGFEPLQDKFRDRLFPTRGTRNAG
jgi:hypothetical protein